jgi:MFS family permease
MPLTLTLISIMGSVTFGFQLGYTGPISALPTIPSEFGGDFSWFSSVLSLGMIVGGFLGGPCVDRLGRKMTMLANTVP